MLDCFNIPAARCARFFADNSAPREIIYPSQLVTQCGYVPIIKSQMAPIMREKIADMAHRIYVFFCFWSVNT